MNKPENYNQLAKALGETRQYIAWLKRQPDAPAGLSIKEWTEFISTRKIVSKATPEMKGAMAEAKLKKLQAEARREERKDKLESGQMCLRSEIKTECIAAMAVLFDTLRTKLESNLPVECAGLDAIGIQAKNKTALDAAEDEVRERLEKLTK